VFDRTDILFDREAMPGTNNYGRSFYCQIERQGSYQATGWCTADQEVCSGPAFLKALKKLVYIRKSDCTANG